MRHTGSGLSDDGAGVHVGFRDMIIRCRDGDELQFKTGRADAVPRPG